MTALPEFPTCPKCGALPSVIIGLPVIVTFARSGDGYVATVSTDLAELSDNPDGVVWPCGHGDDVDVEHQAEADHAIVPYLDRIHETAAPSLDVSL